jgi:hypothetical protein
MACGLQMGIRVMVGMNNHTSSKLHEPDFECFQVFFLFLFCFCFVRATRHGGHEQPHLQTACA